MGISKKGLSNIKFIVVPIGTSLGSDLNTCYLCQNDWDDFGFKTNFNVHFISKEGEAKELGRVSVACKGFSGGYIKFPETKFDQLPPNYCSLGNSQSYYEELMELSESDRNSLLIGLRDCVYQQDILIDFKGESSFVGSLLRHVSINNIRGRFRDILERNAELTPYKFSFKINGDKSAKIDFEVIPNSNPPSNIHVLVGRNGVGKTRILSGLADCITGISSPETISQAGEVEFSDADDLFLISSESYERFTNLITVVFSAFDHFKPMNGNSKQSKIPYQYIGLKNGDGKSFKSPDSLRSDFMSSIETCLMNSQKKIRWIEAINILNSDPIFRDYELASFDEGASLDRFKQIFDQLSSGHKFILLTITKLVDLVDEKTLVLIDEPENHLHPPLLSSFIRAISNLLIRRNAVAIIATHSPVVLQEVLRLCVTKIDRVRSHYTLYRPEQETYAENIGTLTREVFQLEVLDSGFYKTIQDFLNQNKNFDQLINDFNNQVGSEGRAIARSIIATDQGDRTDHA